MSFSSVRLTLNRTFVIFLVSTLAVGCSTVKMDDTEAARNPAGSTCVFDTMYPNWKRELLIHHFYVEQGSSTFIRTPSGTTILIDAGMPGVGDQAILKVFTGCGITSLDYGIVSHPHIDHYGGWKNIYDAGIKAKTFYISTVDTDNDPSPTGLWTKLLTVIGNYSVPAFGLGAILDKDVKFDILAVDGRIRNNIKIDIRKPGKPHVLKDCNAASIAMVLHYRKFAYFEGGDLTAAGAAGKAGKLPLEEAVAPLVKHVDVFHSTHHGSDTSNSKELLGALTPTYSVVSVGISAGGRISKNGDITKLNPDGTLADNPLSFHLPNVEALNRMDQFGSKNIYLTSVGETELVVGDGKTAKRYPVDIMKDKSVKANLVDNGGNDIMLVTDGYKFGFFGQNIRKNESGPFNATGR